MSPEDDLSIPCRDCGAAEGEPCGPPCVGLDVDLDLDGFGIAYSDADPGL